MKSRSKTRCKTMYCAIKKKVDVWSRDDNIKRYDLHMYLSIYIKGLVLTD